MLKHYLLNFSLRNCSVDTESLPNIDFYPARVGLSFSEGYAAPGLGYSEGVLVKSPSRARDTAPRAPGAQRTLVVEAAQRAHQGPP